MKYRRRLILSIALYLLGLGCMCASILHSLRGYTANPMTLEEGIPWLTTLILLLVGGYVSIIISQLALFSEVWKIGRLEEKLEESS